MRRKLLGLGLAVILALGGLTACGGNSGANAGDNQPTAGALEDDINVTPATGGNGE